MQISVSLLRYSALSAVKSLSRVLQRQLFPTVEGTLIRASVPNPHSSCIVVIAISAVLFQAMSMNAFGSSAARRTPRYSFTKRLVLRSRLLNQPSAVSLSWVEVYTTQFCEV